ncbi:hypothetical protein EPI10_010716 [Gossypium australe]|uniref:Uncharacterized protein n=1 Tax=Gossypium australe TaxID=47621 RepID=A0A5B6W6C2_9ROSI|nr:hypothetical protein EPI10_010716 [Gossypium australe]
MFYIEISKFSCFQKVKAYMNLVKMCCAFFGTSPGFDIPTSTAPNPKNTIPSGCKLPQILLMMVGTLDMTVVH